MAVESRPGQEIERQIASNKAEMLAGLRKIHKDFLAERGLKSEDYVRCPGFGRLLTEEEIKKLSRR